MARPPSGTITFLFTDIEGSTRLWQEFPAQMQVNLARHDALLRAAIEQNDGYVFKTVGDAFCAAFPTAQKGLQAAIELQKSLAQTDWGEAVIKVRMGLHTGEAEERDNDYFGNTLNRVARLMSAGHGGQTLLSLATRDMVWNQLPGGATLADFGERRLKDLFHPEHIYQLDIPGLTSVFPPLKTLEGYRHNLPAQLTSFIGREKEIAEVKRLVRANRLTTLIGPGGTGKTRLSLQAAVELFNTFPDGIWLVEFAPLADPALVLKTVTSTLGLREEVGRPLLDILTDYLREKELLLILDNCEHLVEAAAQLTANLLAICPKLQVIASSREVLGIPGEIPFRVPPLSIPDARHLPPLESVRTYEAVQLFSERARLVLPTFGLTNDNALAVAQICQRLDGIPLALELAAARANLLKVEQIASRLDDAFRLLTGSSRTALPRQQTLRATIDWSYNLLAESERLLLRRLAVFVGGWTLEAAETVCADQQAHPTEILDLLAALVNKSLVMVERDPTQEARYRLLETVRQYAREKFSESGEAQALRARHLTYFHDLARRAEPEVVGAQQLLWMDRLETELDNLRAALEWSLEGDEQGVEIGLQMASHLWWFWFSRGYGGGEWMEKMLQASQNSTDLVGRATALSRLGWVRFFDEPYAEAGLALGRTLGPAGRESVAWALLGKSAWAWYQADYPRAQSLAEESLALFRAIADRLGLCEVLTWLGMALIDQEEYPQARMRLDESLTLARKAHDANEIAFAVWQLGRTAMLQADYAQAIPLLQEALAIFQDIKQSGGIGFLLSDLGKAAMLKGDHPQAVAYCREMLALYWKLGDERWVGSSLEKLAYVAVAQLQSGPATRLLGAVDILRETSGNARYPFEIPDYENNVKILRSQLGTAAFDHYWAEGRAMPLKQAVMYALDDAQ